MSDSTRRQQDWNPDAVPGLAPPPPAALSEEVFVVDGERFRVSEHPPRGRLHTYHYDWLTGPNPGYGFGSSGPRQTGEDHLLAIHHFIADIDPDTGYLSESESSSK